MKISLLGDVHFEVILSNTVFKVSLSDKYYEFLVKKLSNRRSKEELIEASFKFLLARETKSQILKEFNLNIIKNYFPEFENEIGNYL